MPEPTSQPVLPEAATAAWDATGAARLVVAAGSARAALAAFLDGLLALALDGRDAPGEGTAAVPVGGRGDDLGAVAADLADALLGQLQEHGAGLRDVRLDGILRGDGGRWSAWGYLVGNAAGPPPREVALAGPVEVADGPGGAVRLAATLVRRQGPA